MPLPKTIRQILYALVGLVALLLVLLLILTLVQIPIDLTGYKGIVEAAASRAVGRTIKIDGKIQVTTSLWPSFQMQGLRITNPKGFQTDNFAIMKSAKAQISVLPLLLGKIHIIATLKNNSIKERNTWASFKLKKINGRWLVTHEQSTYISAEDEQDAYNSLGGQEAKNVEPFITNLEIKDTFGRISIEEAIPLIEKAAPENAFAESLKDRKILVINTVYHL